MSNQKECAWCKEFFTPKRSDSKYCPKNHYTACENCGAKILIKKMSRIPKFCTTSCASKSREKNKECVCKICGESFIGTKTSDNVCSKKHVQECCVCKKIFVIHNPHKPAKTCSKKCALATVDMEKRLKKTRETNKKKYGVENVSQSIEIKKIKEASLLLRYGVKNPSLAKEVQQKRERTNLKKYGVKSVLSNKEIREKIRETNKKKYGSENVFTSPVFQKKIRETIFKKYGVDNIFQLPEVKERALANGHKTISKINLTWKEKLKNAFGVDFHTEVPFGNYYADLGFDNILIDINPTITHNSTIPFAHALKYCTQLDCVKHVPIARDYHQQRALVAESEGKILLQFFDWMDENAFLNIVRTKLRLNERTIYARSCSVREIPQSEANKFLRKYHLDGGATKQKVCVGLFHNEELVHVNTYGPARMSTTYEWEAIRSCTKENTHVVGGLTRCEKFFIKNYSPASLVSYVNLSISSGRTEEDAAGMSAVRTHRPSAIWVNALNNNNPAFIRDHTARRVSADRLIGFEVGEKYPRFDENGKKVTNTDVLIAEGYVQVFDAGVRTFATIFS